MSDLEAPVLVQDYTGSYYEPTRIHFHSDKPLIVYINDDNKYECEYKLEHDQEYIYTICNNHGQYMTMGEQVFRDENLLFYKITKGYDSNTMRGPFSKEEINSNEMQAYEQIMQEYQDRELREQQIREQQASQASGGLLGPAGAARSETTKRL